MRLLLSILAIGILVGAGFYYRGAIATGFNNLVNPHPDATPVLVDVGVPTVTPTPAAKPTATPVTSIATLKTTPRTIATNSNLPTSGPEDFAVPVAVGGLASIQALYRLGLRRRVKRSAHTIDIV